MGSLNTIRLHKYNFMGYLFFWTGQLTSLLGSSIVQFSIVWWVTLETNSAFLLGISSIATFGTELILTPFAGVLVDRWSRKKIIIVADTSLALNTLVLILLFHLEIINYWYILIILVFSGICQAFHIPAVDAIIPILVPPEKLSRVNGWTYLANGVIFMIGPVLSAILLELWLISDILWIDIITFLIAVLTTISITIPDVRKKQNIFNNDFSSEFKEGISFISNKKGLLTLLSVFTVSNFLESPLFVLLPLLVTSIHMGNAGDLAIIQFFNNLGVLIGAMIMSSSKGFKKNVHGVVLGLLIANFALLAIPLAPIGIFWILWVLFFVYGFFLPITNVSSQNIWQKVVPPEKIGRVFSIRTAIAQLSFPIGTFIGGLFAEFYGINSVLFLNAVFGIFFLIFIWYKTDLSIVEYDLFSSKDRVIKNSEPKVETCITEGLK